MALVMLENVISEKRKSIFLQPSAQRQGFVLLLWVFDQDRFASPFFVPATDKVKRSPGHFFKINETTLLVRCLFCEASKEQWCCLEIFISIPSPLPCCDRKILTFLIKRKLLRKCACRNS
ncbi:hypothetical protein CDAR_79111 [Caerostris darwini]|uniref:Uncharacterized protein n=1 Tax=Caerostris darwini TaxID=1538125 RepID=A0AAV4S7B5_9ARAC|nr:hypothetical protein CDAR_79111 [Caerostris darwini]